MEDDTKIKALNDLRKAKGVKYGGKNIDPGHLGGWIHNDTDTYESQLWERFIDEVNITSVIDIGCGLGYSTKWFTKYARIQKVLCVEGSTDAIQKSLVPHVTIQHDYRYVYVYV